MAGQVLCPDIYPTDDPDHVIKISGALVKGLEKKGYMAVDNYHGGTNRVGWNNVFHFWRGYILRSPRIVCTSFGDPYRLYDIPFAKTYINAYSCTDESQRATAKVIMGKIPALGKSPVELKGYFKREV